MRFYCFNFVFFTVQEFYELFLSYTLNNCIYNINLNTSKNPINKLEFNGYYF